MTYKLVDLIWLVLSSVIDGMDQGFWLALNRSLNTLDSGVSLTIVNRLN